MNNDTQKITGDLIRLSDLFRRHASFSEQKEAFELVNLTREMVVLQTYYYHEYGDKIPENRKTSEAVAEKIKQIANCAVSVGLDSIVLPYYEDSYDAQVIQKQILDCHDFAVTIQFRTSDYNQDLAGMGEIDTGINTVLDEGIRGVAAIKPDLVNKWDRDIKAGPQLKLGM